MENNLVLTTSLFVIFSAVLYFGGKFLIYRQISEDKTASAATQAVRLWRIFAILISAALAANLLLNKNRVLWTRLSFILLYICLFCLVISIVDIFTHNFYLEMLPFLFILPAIGWYTFGLRNMTEGMLFGLILNILLVLTEAIATKKISYGGADVLFSIAASGLVSKLYVIEYWLLVSLSFIIYMLAIFICKKIKKENINKNEMTALLPAFSIPACIVYTMAASGLFQSLIIS